jgi:hypothetical protein
LLLGVVDTGEGKAGRLTYVLASWQKRMSQMVQVLPELQIIQVGLWDCSNTIECSRKVAGNSGNRIRITATVDGLKERLSEVLR